MFLLLFLLLPVSLASASHCPFHHRPRQMSSLSFTPPSLPISSLSPSLPLPLTSLSPSLASLTPPPNPPTTSPTPSSSSSLSSASSLASSIPSSSAASSATLPSTSSTPIAPGDVTQQPSHASSTPTIVAASASLSDPSLSSSVVVYTSAIATASPTAARSSSSGFFANTGAVASTFTVVGIVGIAGVIAVALLIIRRRHSRSYDEDMEYLDRTPDLSHDPPMTQVTSDDGFTSDHGHYGTSPMALASPPAAYYPDHAYALHPQAFPANSPPSHGYPAAYTQDYLAQRIYSPDDRNMTYPTSTPRVDPDMPNPHEFADLELDSAPGPSAQIAPPDALRPSVRPSPTIPKQWGNARFSVDSFYAGIATDNQPPAGQAF